MAALFIGGELVVRNATSIARVFNLSETLIGLTIVAAGTSLPELATSLTAAVKKNSDIAVGNIIGSNIFNILLVGAVSAIIRPVRYASVFDTDIYILAAGTLLLILFMWTGEKKKLDRWEAVLLFAAFIIYRILSINLHLT